MLPILPVWLKLCNALSTFVMLFLSFTVKTVVTSTLPGLSKKAEKLLLIRRKNSRFVNVSVDVFQKLFSFLKKIQIFRKWLEMFLSLKGFLKLKCFDFLRTLVILGNGQKQ